FAGLPLRIRRSGILCLLGVIERAGEITCCRLEARLCEVSEDSLRKPFRNLLEDFHCFSTLLLTLQLSAVRITLWRSGNVGRWMRGGFRLVRAIQGFEDIRLGAEIIEPFLILN